MSDMKYKTVPIIFPHLKKIAISHNAFSKSETMIHESCSKSSLLVVTSNINLDAVHKNAQTWLIQRLGECQ